MTLTHRTAQAAGAALLALALIVALAGTVAAQATQAPSVPVTDYAGYPGPDDGVPVGCAAGDMAGLAFQRARAGAPTVSGPELNALGVIAQGDTLTMTWTGVAPECVGGLATLVIKRAASAVFNIADNQEFVAGVSVTVDGGPGQLTLVASLDPLNGACFVQIDAVYGRPLAIVGPGGSYYGSFRPSGGPNVLESFYNGELGPCVAQPTTTLPPTTTVPSTTVPPVTTAAPTTTVPPPTTQPPTTAPPATATTAAPATTATTPAQATGGAARQTIPTTGTTTQALQLGLILLVAGALVLYRARRLPR